MITRIHLHWMTCSSLLWCSLVLIISSLVSSSLLWSHHLFSGLIKSSLVSSYLLFSFIGISHGADQVHTRCGRRSEDHEEGERRGKEAWDTITTQYTYTADTVICVSNVRCGKGQRDVYYVYSESTQPVHTYERTRKSVRGKTYPSPDDTCLLLFSAHHKAHYSYPRMPYYNPDPQNRFPAVPGPCRSDVCRRREEVAPPPR
jgi:hypothetical protein